MSTKEGRTRENRLLVPGRGGEGAANILQSRSKKEKKGRKSTFLMVERKEKSTDGQRRKKRDLAEEKGGKISIYLLLGEEGIAGQALPRGKGGTLFVR